MSKLYYKPDNGWAADFIPFFAKDTFYLYYLHDYRNKATYGEGTPWYLLTSKDLVTFTEHGEVLSRGQQHDQDLYVFTGCVYQRAENDYLLFYTGHNPHFKDKPQQAVMIAHSEDLIHWQKMPEYMFFAPLQGYEPDDWRDPFVFFDPDRNRYIMLLAARLSIGGARRRGCTARCSSEDLLHWTVEEPLWMPDVFFTHECPDLFKLGDYWYLVFSEFSHRRCTQYRYAKSLEGPWLVPEGEGIFDGVAFYAAKTVSDGQNRYLIGWNPTKKGEHDIGRWQWGGNLVIHQLISNGNPGLDVVMPPFVRNRFVDIIYEKNELDIGERGVCTMMNLPVKLPDTYMIHVAFSCDGDSSRAGVALRNNTELDNAYWYSIYPKESKFEFDKFPNGAWQHDNFVGMNKQTHAKDDVHYELEIVVEGGVCVGYLNGRTVLSSRMYEGEGCPVAIVSVDGITRFHSITVRALSKEVTT